MPADETFRPATGFKSGQGPELLFLGRVVENKGLHLLLDAMAEIRTHFPGASLVVVGGANFGSNVIDPYLASLHAKAAALGDAVQFVGPVPHAEIAGYLARADVFVCPSIWNDPFPLVNLEAMGAGVPVVAFARGGIPEAVGDAGILVEDVSAPSLAAAICALLGDGARRHDLAARGRERVRRHFTWDRIASRWEQRLIEMLDHKTGGS